MRNTVNICPNLHKYNETILGKFKKKETHREQLLVWPAFQFRYYVFKPEIPKQCFLLYVISKGLPLKKAKITIQNFRYQFEILK